MRTRIRADGLDWAALRCGKPTVYQTPAWLDFLRETQNVEPVIIEITREEKPGAFFIDPPASWNRRSGKSCPGMDDDGNGVCTA